VKAAVQSKVTKSREREREIVRQATDDKDKNKNETRSTVLVCLLPQKPFEQDCATEKNEAS
jgi:hypothetical protein